MESTSRQRFVLIGGITLALLAGAAYWTLGRDPAAPAPEAAATDPARMTLATAARLGIRVEPARATDAVPVGTVPGVVTLPPAARVAVTSPFAGTAVRVMVVPGQRVRQGEALAVVRAPETVQFGAELARAEADHAFARANAARLETLAREGVIAGVRADEARAALRRSEASTRENRRLLTLAGASADGTVTLRAPIAGRVATVALDTGAPVGAAAAAPFVIENDAALALDLQLPERMAAQVRPGMAVTVTGTGGRPAATGQVLAVAPSLDPATRSILARASLAGGGATGLVPGTGVMAVISGDGGTTRRGVAVPSGAVARMDGADYVFVHAGGRFARRKVEVAADTGGTAILAAGLKPGETVAVSGVAELKSALAGH